MRISVVFDVDIALGIHQAIHRGVHALSPRLSDSRWTDEMSALRRPRYAVQGAIRSGHRNSLQTLDLGQAEDVEVTDAARGVLGIRRENWACDLPFRSVVGIREKEGAMARIIAARRIFGGIGHFLERTAAVVLGLVLMVVGLGLGVTMIMLPVGITIGLLGVALVVGGLFARIDER
jgi:hypothetical protein